ncbi:MAG TPA: GNAT family N-acetyltransferase [Thermoleophilia bacterium]|nr:GNAT family N-acetyltransferase [Thermoleophilia bacterium]
MRTEPRQVLIRGAEARDEARVRAALERSMAGVARCAPPPRLLFEHFGPTGFVAESNGEVVGFLLGFVSQTYPGEACIHAVWVRPDRRRAQLGTALYECFVAAAHEQYCSVVRAWAAGTDGGAIAFHQALGFVVDDEDQHLGGPLSDADREAGESYVNFVRLVSGPSMAHPRPERESAA